MMYDPEKRMAVQLKTLWKRKASIRRRNRQIRDLKKRIIQLEFVLDAAKAAKKYLEPDLVEPGRTVFWNLVSALAKAQEEPKP